MFITRATAFPFSRPVSAPSNGGAVCGSFNPASHIGAMLEAIGAPESVRQACFESDPSAAARALPLDIAEQEGDLVVRCDLPGFGKDEINVQIQEGVLTISASRSAVEESVEPEQALGTDTATAAGGTAAGETNQGETATGGAVTGTVQRGAERFWRRERWSGSVARRIKLPARFADSEPTAELRDGVLTLRFPESRSAKPRRVAIG